MKYSFTAEATTKDRTVKMFFDADDARDLRGAWQGIAHTLRDLKFALIIEDYSMEADKDTADVWEERGYI